MILQPRNGRFFGFGTPGKRLLGHASLLARLAQKNANPELLISRLEVLRKFGVSALTPLDKFLQIIFHRFSFRFR